MKRTLLCLLVGLVAVGVTPDGAVSAEMGVAENVTLTILTSALLETAPPAVICQEENCDLELALMVAADALLVTATTALGVAIGGCYMLLPWACAAIGPAQMAEGLAITGVSTSTQGYANCVGELMED
jgi:hypothetical protein